MIDLSILLFAGPRTILSSSGLQSSTNSGQLCTLYECDNLGAPSFIIVDVASQPSTGIKLLLQLQPPVVALAQHQHNVDNLGRGGFFGVRVLDSRFFLIGLLSFRQTFLQGCQLC